MWNEYYESLGRRAIACAGWQWVPGMRVRVATGNGWAIARVVDVPRAEDEAGRWVRATPEMDEHTPEVRVWWEEGPVICTTAWVNLDVIGGVPDFADGATVGALQEQVIEEGMRRGASTTAWTERFESDEEAARAGWDLEQVTPGLWMQGLAGRCPLAEALVAALEGHHSMPMRLAS